MWHRFDKIAQQVFVHAQEEAERCGHRYVCTEHVLLALVRDRASISWRLAQSAGASPAVLRQEVRKHIVPETRAKHVEMQLTPRVKRVIDLALVEAARWQCKHVGSEHLLLALVLERNGLAGRMLAKHGITLEQMRREVAKLPMYATLLRPASHSPSSPNTLLRPAESSTQTPAQELLRTTSEPQNEMSMPRPENKPGLRWRLWQRRK